MSLRSLGRVSLNRSNTWVDDVGAAAAALGVPQRLFTVCASGWLTRSENMDWKDGRGGGGGGSFSLAVA